MPPDPPRREHAKACSRFCTVYMHICSKLLSLKKNTHHNLLILLQAFSSSMYVILIYPEK